MMVISTVLVATTSPQSNVSATSSDRNKLLPASDPWAVAADSVAFISTPSAVSASSESNPSTTAPNVELLPASNPWAIAQNPVTFVSTPLATSASPECHSHAVPDYTHAPAVCLRTALTLHGLGTALTLHGLGTALTLRTALIHTTARILASALTMRSLAASLVNSVHYRDCEELLPASDPRSVAPHSMMVISTVLVATTSPQSNVSATSSDRNKLLPASDPWA